MLVLFFGIIINALKDPIIDSYENCNNFYDNLDNPYVTYLSTFESTEDCINACLNVNKNNPTQFCNSYTYFTNISTTNQKQCYIFINNPMWIPYNYNSDNINCGRIIYPCTSNYNCSLNGKCNINTGECECNKAWKGYQCDTLNLLPATKYSGYNPENISSWGGSVQYNNDKQVYTMFVAEMVNNCGINSWLTNSQIIIAIADRLGINGYNTQYNKIATILPPFAHSPDIIYASDTNEYVLIYVHNLTNNIKPSCNICINGTTNSNCDIKNNMTEVTSIRYIDDLTDATNIDNWSEPILIGNIINGDSNFAAQILKNGSLIGMVRANDTQTHTLIYPVFAQNWKDNTSYIVDYTLNNGKGLFPYFPKNGGCEDMYIYQDCNGYWHGLTHNMSPIDYPGGSETMAGGHMFSKNGINWQYTGVAFTNLVEYNDGTNYQFIRRERPHLIFDKDNCTPIALSSGVEYFKDATYTLIQPIAN